MQTFLSRPVRLFRRSTGPPQHHGRTSLLLLTLLVIFSSARVRAQAEIGLTQGATTLFSGATYNFGGGKMGSVCKI